MDLAKITEMRRDKSIVSNLKATDGQLVDDLNGVLSTPRKKMLQTMPAYIDELSRHIKELDDEIDRDMKDEEKSPPPTFRKSPESAAPVRKWSFLESATDTSRFLQTAIFRHGQVCV